MKELHIDINNWEDVAEDRGRWRRAIQDGLVSYADDMRRHDNLRRERRHRARANGANGQNDDINNGFICYGCGRICGSRIGLFSHERSCRGAIENS